MTITEALKVALKERKMTQLKLGEMLGYTSKSAIAERLRAGNSITVKLALKMLDVLDYELVIQPKKPGRRPAGQIVIESTEKEEQE